MTDTLADRTFALLARHKVPGLVSLALFAASRCEELCGIVSYLIPSRLVHYDTECVYSPTDITEVLGRFAAATHWDWELNDPRAEFNEDPLQRRATVEFRWKDAPVQWNFVQETDWLANEFVEHVLAFARTELPGEFIKLPSKDQTAYFIYLAQPAAGEFRRLLAEDGTRANAGPRGTD